ncbi:GntR family transcriptional regulator [Roseibium polysiphoniae]|uniref:GntR family transcriptional regulator n=1 Tax=Roseibium polysiphoniae TaxID=2571221 RepID=A0A944CDI9_9HYPH|nr:GntR family transcriptional regulator [Roseibium polysiphoniae]
MREKTRVDTIYETLRDRICLGVCKSGEVFHEAELGQEFEVSRTPIRQVLQRLAFEKLAVVRTGVGTIVEDVTSSDAQNYLEMHARVLATVAELGLYQAAIDFEDAAASLEVRSSRISGSVDVERFWNLLKAVQELNTALLEDDLLRQMDDLMFYRCGPALMAGVRQEPEKAAELLKANVMRLVAALDASDCATFFEAQAENLRLLKGLLKPN